MMKRVRPFFLLFLPLRTTCAANLHTDRWQLARFPRWQRRHRIHLLGWFLMLQCLRHPFLQLLDARAAARMSGQKFRRLMTAHRLLHPLPEHDGFVGVSLAFIALGAWVPVVLEWALLAGAPAFAESPTITVQWGGLAFPDQAATLSVGGTINRFTEVDNTSLTSLHYESTLTDTFGLNLVSISWTKQWDCAICEGITTKVTAGAALIPEEPGKHQTDIHNILGLSQSGIGGMAGSSDGMSALVSRLFSFQRNGNGVAFGTSFVRTGGTLSKDLFERSIARGLTLPIDVGLPERFSLMGRVSMTQQFWSLSYRYADMKVETWNQTPYRSSSAAQRDFGFAVAYTVIFDGKGWRK